MQEPLCSKRTNDHLLGNRPVEFNALARSYFLDGRVIADGAPDLRLELSGGNIIAKEFIVSSGVSTEMHCTAHHASLTAVEATGPLHDIAVTVSNSTADGARVAPHHLREVAPGGIVVGVVVGVLGLFLVPAVRGGAGKLDPGVVVGRGGCDRRQVAARAFLEVVTTTS